MKRYTFLLVFMLLLTSFKSFAYVWDGSFDATYNPCDGSFTFTTFLFQDCPNCDDYVNANFALQFKDNTGTWQKIVLVKAAQIINQQNGWGNQFTGTFNNLNVQQWRLEDGNIGNFTVSNGNINPFIQNNWINVLNENDTNSFAFAFSTLATIGFYNQNIPGQNQIFNNNWWANSGGVYQEPKFQVTKVTLGLATYIVLKWINPPAYLRNQSTAQFRMPFATTTSHTFGPKNDVTPFNTFQTPASTKTVSVDQLKVPSGVVATKNNNCNSVTLNWSPVEDYCNTSFLQVYRDGNWYQFINNPNASTFTDNNPVKGVSHSYTVRVGHWQPGSCTGCAGQEFFQGAWSQPAVGKVKSAPPAPFGLTATDNKCNKTIELAWNVNQSIIDATPHTAFRLERASNSSFTSGLTTFDNLGEGTRSFIDTSIAYNIPYFYRVMAKNGCSDNSYDISVASNTSRGIAPGNPPLVTSITVDSIPVGKVRIFWNDPSPYESNYIVTRSLLTGGGSTDLVTLPANSTQFVDSLAQICVDYVYKIKATNVCNTSGVESNVLGQIKLNPSLTNTFQSNTTKILKASKGYYPNRVELNWSNNNGVSVTGWKIYRKNMTTGTGDSVLIASPSASSGQYIDYTTDANIFYKYTIVGEALCGNTTLKTNTSEDIGFRYPSGTISGHVSYEGGINVKDVKVTAQTSSGTSGYALNFSGDNISGAQIASSTTLNNNTPYTIEFWIKPTVLLTNGTILKKSNYTGNTHYAIEYNPLTNMIDFYYQQGGVMQKVSANYGLSNGSYVHVTAVKDNNSLKLFKNGALLNSFTTTTPLTSIPNVPIDLGYNSNTNTNKFAGNIDELRIYKRAKDSLEISRDFNRYINPEDNDLVAYFPLDENINSFGSAYDLSKSNNVFNENKLTFNSGVTFSSSIPNNAQLNNVGYTDTNGFYVINACKYNSTGQNFTMTPIFGTHSFTPSNKIEFVGEGSTNKSNVDFTDNSSFIFNGKVMYKNSSCAMEGAVVYIDDAAVIKAGEIIKSDADGKFQIRVPIGQHFVSVKYPFHDFSVGRFPLTSGTQHNFQANVAGEYQFVDSTLRKVVGRVVGGQVEGGKALNLGRSINNIGKARLIFETIKGDGCKKDTVWTADSSGEYVAYLLPIKYKVGDIRIPSNLGMNFVNSEGIGKQLDLTAVHEYKSIIDTLYKYVDSSGASIRQIVRVDSSKYNFAYSYIHRNQSTIVMKGKYETNPITHDSLFIGEQSLLMNGNQTVSLIPYIPGSTNNTMKYPVFKQYNTYNAKFEITENYENRDINPSNPIISRYPVSGILNITNYIGTNSGSFAVGKSGIFNWSFMGSIPSLLVNNLVPDYSYTNPLQVIFNSDGAAAVEYKPFPENTGQNLDGLYRAYVFGERGIGTNFVTRDVDKVSFILRDPPGTNSFASWTTGSKYSRKEFSSKETNLGGALENRITIGAKSKLTLGAGGFVAPIILTDATEIEQKTNVEANNKYNYKKTSSSGTTTETENLATISTSSSADEVGHMADVFIGDGKNTIFGGAVQLCLVDTNQCGISNYECIGNKINNKYKLAKYNRISIGKGTAVTRFHYTTREIEEIVIPNLETLRNNLFAQFPQIYKLNFTDVQNKVKYASNNDDQNAWGTSVGANGVSSANPRQDDFSDSTGQSYTFYPSKNNVADSIDVHVTIFNGSQPIDSVYYIKVPSIDEVRQYNKQILQWKIELAKNEREKYKALGPNADPQNLDNISVGTAIIQKTLNSSTTKEWNVEENHTLSNEIALNIAAKFTIFGVNLETANRLSFNTENSWNSGDETTNNVSTSFQYVFQDENQGDLLNLAVKNPTDGGGHIFKVLAGQTSCPYQAAEYLKWYNPTANDNSDNFTYLYPSSESGSTIEFSPRTVQIDVPSITIAQPVKINIPSDEPAVFNMILGNLSEANKTRDYTLKVDLVSNPFGAIIKVDGLDPNRTFTVPSGAGINKVITVEKGPTKFNYDSILLIFHTACDIDKENIADSVYISAHFIPACNKATLQSPGDLWVANNIVGDTLPIIINGYNYNFEGFSNIQFKYKKSNTSIWNTQEIFYRDTAGLNNPNAKLIPTTNNFIDYKWAIKDNTDGPYDLKLDVRCDFQNFPNIVREMPKQIGIIDKINPVPFGTPSPGDGILDPNDDISIQFNEPLDNGTLTYNNFDIRGVLNETPIRNSTSLFFNGTTNYMEVPGDVNLQQRDFTIETWIKRGDIGRKQTLFSQGSDANQAIEIGFDTDNKLYYRVGSGTNNEMIKSDNAMTDLTDWHHLALTYNHAAEEVQMYWDGTYVNGNVTNHMYTDNLSTGKMQIAKNLSTNNQYFKGNLHEIRVWNKFRTLSEIVQTMNKTVNRSNPGTLFNWKLDEAEGTQAKDDIRERNATIYGATWMVDPSSKSIALNGSNQYVKVESGNYGITKEMDMTLELWFNSAQTGVASLISNGKGYQYTDSITAWNIEKDATGKIHVKNNNFDWVATDSNYFDGQWHHLALVLNRKANTILYIDGNQQKAISSQKFGEFGGGNVYLGALGYYNGSLFNVQNYLNGNVDEFRFWNTARLVEQIKRDKQNRLKGDEYGLLSYVPFEEYVEVSGVPSLNATMKDIADTSHDVTPMNSASHSAMTPTLKLPRAVQSILFTYVLNNDKIILTPTTAAKFIENVTLDITTKGVKDKNGNYQQSPKTWIAYIDKNQVVWGNDAFTIDKKLNEARTINTSIANKGGATKQFTIDNIPAWMTVSPTSGVIAPNSVLPVTIEIDANLAIGDYENDVQLLTDFGFAEKLNIKVKCRANAPIWTVDASKFQYSMNIIGKLKINQVISSDIEDKIAIFVGDVCRGVANVKYVPQYDDYYVFIDVYSNDVSGAEVFKSKIWDASVGAILTDVTPEVLFESNTLKGTMSTPIIFNANNTFAQIIPINTGWNWISANVISNDSNHFDRLLKSLNSVNGDAIKSQISHRLFNSTTNWTGSLAAIVPDKGYMLKSSVDDTLIIDGVLANPTIRPINLVAGWNWIGFNSIRNLSLNQALGGLNPVHEDLIKGKNNFAVYDQAIGWIGSLSAMKSGEGYLYKSAGTNSFYYPIAGYYKGGIDEDELKNTYFDVKSNEFESNMNLIVKLNCTGLDKNSTQTLAALDEKGICRGAIKLKYLESIQTSIAFLSIAGNADENLKFRLYDEKSKKIISINESISFTPNSIMGSIQSPYTLKVSNDACNTLSIASNIPLNDYYVNVFPNEIKNDINIEFGGKVNDIVRFELYDIQGKSLVQFEKNKSQLNRKFTLNSMYPSISELAGGVYLLKVEINGQSQTFKLVK